MVKRRPALFAVVAIAVLGAVLITAPNASAATVAYSVTNTSGNMWRYDYEVTNDTLASHLEEFTIYFDLNLFEDMTVVSSPAGWDSIAVQPDAGLPDDGFFDALALGAGIGPGEFLGGFSVSFAFLGQGSPGAQRFDILNPITLAVLESGTTTVPAPSAGILLATAAMALSMRLRWRRPRRLRGTA